MRNNFSSTSPLYAWYVVLVLTLFYMISFIDRQILAVLVVPMKADLGLTDVQLSYIGGLSFIIIYSLCGIPIGRLADQYSRRGIIATGVVFWSATTTLCGFASHFWQFLLLRMGVGLGEAALSPSAFSIIADIFPRNKLATAISVYSMGAAIGLGLSYLGGALILDWAIHIVASGGIAFVPVLGGLKPWQLVFLVVGLPGLFLSLLLFTIKEPARKNLRAAQSTGTLVLRSAYPVREVFAYYLKNWQGLALHNLGMAALAFATFGAAFWDLVFLNRTYDWSPNESGIYYGLIAMFGQAIGGLTGGRLADFFTRKGVQNSTMLIMLISALAWIPFGIAYPLMPTIGSCLLILIPVHFFAGMPWGCAAAAVQEMAPSQMRGQLSAFYLFVMNIIGVGLGPTAVAFLTEHAFRDLNMLRYSLLLVGVVGHILAGILFFFSLKPHQNVSRRVSEMR